MPDPVWTHRLRGAVIVLALLAILAFVNAGIYQREQLLTSGRVILLELAPVDPRSLMQGDYMRLDYRLGRDVATAVAARGGHDGRVVLAVDDRGVASLRRLDDGTPVDATDVLLRYRVREGRPRFVTNAYFFEEGHGQDFTAARYGEFRVAPDGEALLTGLRDANLAPLALKPNPG